MIDKTPFIALRHQGWTYQQIADKFGCTKQNVGHMLKKDATKVILLTCACGARYKFRLRGRGTQHRCCPQCVAAKTLAQYQALFNTCACGQPKTRTAVQCMQCYARNIHKVNFPLARWLYERGYSTIQIGEYFGCAQNNIYMKLRKRGVKMRARGTGHAASRKAMARMSIEEAAQRWQTLRTTALAKK